MLQLVLQVQNSAHFSVLTFDEIVNTLYYYLNLR